MPEVMQNTDPLPSGSIDRQDHISLHQSQIPSGLQVPRVTQIPDQQNSISRDEVRELGASVKELVSQLRVLTWNLTSMSEQFKDVRGALTILSDQQEASQSKIQDIEEVVSQHSGSGSVISKKLIHPEEIGSQHSRSGSVISRKSIHSEEVGSHHSETGSKAHSIISKSQMSDRSTHASGFSNKDDNKDEKENKLNSIKAEVEELKQEYNIIRHGTIRSHIERFYEVVRLRPLDKIRMKEACNILEWLFSIGHIDDARYQLEMKRLW